MVKVKDMQKFKDEMIKIRRDIHIYPEIGFELHRTASLVEEKLEEYGYEVITDIAETGLVGVLDTGKPGKTIVIHADMDALAMEDELEKDYASKIIGRAHTCGHDAHIAISLGAAKYIAENKDKLKGKVKFLFQPAAEGGNPLSGAPYVIESGVLDDADAIFGLHVDPSYECGEIAIKYGALYASSVTFDVVIKGKGGHGAYPHLAKDPIIVASQIINDSQTIVSRNTSPMASAVLSFCSINAGDTHNVIPDKAYLGGTIRSLDNDSMNRCINNLEKTIKKICELHDCQYEISHRILAPTLINNDECTKIIEEAAVELIGYDKVINIPSAEMGSEDFAYYCDIAPCGYFVLGVANDKKGITYYTHHPKFDIDEDALEIGAAAFVNIINKYLE